jgi:ectoine hydroxylase-related dioxygenase (phytanoyl-CoA dioxygenase family)
MKITDDQKDFFETFGFLVLRQLLTTDEVATMQRESDEIMTEARDGKPFDGQTRQAVQPFFERRPFLQSLIADPRILAIAEGLLGPDIFMEVTEGNLHIGDTAWHGGSGELEILPMVKIGFYLEPLTRETGALRFIPGSHKGEFSERLKRIGDRIDDPDAKVWGVSPNEVPSYAVESNPGDVVAFKEDTYHGAWGGRDGRHQHAINYAQIPKTEEQMALVREFHERMTYSFHPVVQNLEHENPRIRELQQPMVDWGFETQSV